MRILLICYIPTNNAQTITDHINAIANSQYEVTVINNLGGLPPEINLNYFHVIIIHYTIVMSMNSYLSVSSRKKIRDFQGVKSCFIQDEYRFVDKTIEAINYMNIEIIFTCVPSTEIEKVYSFKKTPGVKMKINVLTGYVPQDLVNYPTKPYHKRTIDVCYRSRAVPQWLGNLGQEKIRIAKKFKEDASNYNLITDISCSEESRIYGQKWIEFLGSSKACLGTESGASVFDFTGNIQKNVEHHLKNNPEESFEELQRRYFKSIEDEISLNQISPRCFEAACLKTLMILYEGDYSGILVPWKHYVPLKKDHSNMKEVVNILNSPDKAQEMIEYCYTDVVLSGKYSYQKFTNMIEQHLFLYLSNHKCFSVQDNLYQKLSLASKLIRLKYMFVYKIPNILSKVINIIVYKYIKKLLPRKIIILIKKIIYKVEEV